MIKKNSFVSDVYRVTKKIPLGKVSSYGLIAKAILRPKAYRAVGNALNKNPFAPTIPCHRVVKSNGNLGGFAKGRTQKIALLKKEGIEVKDGRVINFEKHLYFFKK